MIGIRYGLAQDGHFYVFDDSNQWCSNAMATSHHASRAAKSPAHALAVAVEMQKTRFALWPGLYAKRKAMTDAMGIEWSQA